MGDFYPYVERGRGKSTPRQNFFASAHGPGPTARTLRDPSFIGRALESGVLIVGQVRLALITRTVKVSVPAGARPMKLQQPSGGKMIRLAQNRDEPLCGGVSTRNGEAG